MWAVAAAVGTALLMGGLASSSPAPPRVDTEARAADSAWLAALPADPLSATDAYLGRIPAEARAQGDAFGSTRYVTLPLRILTLLASVALLLFSGAASSCSRVVERFTGRRTARDVVFAFLMLLALFLLNLPVETFAGFVRIRNAGFSDMPFAMWGMDLALRWAIDSAFFVGGLAAIMALIRARPASWAGWATVVYLCVSLLYVIVEPRTEELFNTLTPLQAGPAREAVLSLARANGVPADNVYVRDASRQSGLLNAHVSGVLGSAQIVLDDNTIARTPLAEIEMVMAHEVGHYALGHVIKGLIFSALVMGAGLLIIQVSAPGLIARFGAVWGISGITDLAAVTLLWGLFQVWGYAALPVSNSITRQQETEADLFALNATQDPLAQAEFMIRDADTGEFHPSRIEEWVFYDHPSPHSRILAAMRWRAEHLEP